jgi:hypothetical protein
MPGQVWSAGLCIRHPHPEWWTSSLPPEREAAATVCGWCPVLQACHAWALTLPQADNAIYAGTDAKQRRDLRSAA